MPIIAARDRQDLITLWTRKARNSNLTPRKVPKPSCLKEQGKGRVFKDWSDYLRFLEEKVKELDQPKWNWHNLRHCRASIKNGIVYRMPGWRNW